MHLIYLDVTTWSTFLGCHFFRYIHPNGHTLFLRSNFYYNINYDFSLNKLLIFCLLIVSKVVVKFRYGVEIKGAKMRSCYKALICAL